MNRRRFFVTGLSAGAVAACSSGGSLLSPSLVSQGSRLLRGATGKPIVINVEYGTTTFSNGVMLKGRRYSGGPWPTAGPTIEIRPGETLDVSIVNKLPPNPPAAPVHGELVPQPQNMMDAMDPDFRGGFAPAKSVNKMNNPHDFNTTNLHVHGIQTVPHLFKPLGTSNPSAEMIGIEPGDSFDYSFPIPKDHPCGLDWYHPHHHGSTDVQVSNGMAGLIIVKGPIDEVPEIKAARECVVVVQTLDVNPSKTVNNLYEREYIAYRAPQNGGYFLSTKYTMLTVNGQGRYWVRNVHPTTYTALETVDFAMQPGEVVRVRLLNGTNYLTLPLVLPGFDNYIIGFDGINLLTAQQKDMSGTNTPVINRRNLLKAPVLLASAGNRIELLIQAPMTPGTYTLSSLANHGLYFRNVPKLDLINFVVSGDPKPMSIPTTLPVPKREYPVISDNEIVNRRTFTFAEKFNRTDLLFGVAFTVNNQLYKEMDCQTAPVVGTCEEWTIENAHDEIHPFHLHENSFQLTKVNGHPVNPIEIWDTFLVPPKYRGVNGSITFRVRFKQWYGKTVFHCHVLPHEDTGMMQNILMV